MKDRKQLYLEKIEKYHAMLQAKINEVFPEEETFYKMIHLKKETFWKQFHNLSLRMEKIPKYSESFKSIKTRNKSNLLW